MEILTLEVYPDEPCHGYFCGPRMMPGYSYEENPRIVEFVFVVRGDAIAKYVRDFGCADDYFYIPPLIMPSGGENSVALMQWHGERHRHDDRWARRMREYRESSTLIPDAIRQEQQIHEIIHNRSSFGLAGNYQRDGWPHEHVIRRYKDERARRLGKTRFFV